MDSSLRAKLARSMVRTLVVVAAATLLIVAGFNYVASSRSLNKIQGHLRASIEHKGSGLVANQALGLRDLVMENAFGDVARLVQRTVEEDENLVYGLFLDDSQRAWGFYARPGVLSPRATWRDLSLSPGVLTRATLGSVDVNYRQVRGQSVFEFSMSVVDDKGTSLGKLFYALSDRPLQQALAEARFDSVRALVVTVALLLLLGTATVVMAAVRSHKVAFRITRPLTELTEAANRIASGDRDARVTISSGDELELLGGAFNHMAAELKDSYERLEAMNRTLEAKVQERTRELGNRNRDMRLVMDNVNQGLVTVALDGKLAHERSAITDRWFGPCEREVLFSEYIAKADPTYAMTFKLGYEALIEDVMPRELCMRQLPCRLRYDGREYRCSYFPIVKEGKLDGLLIAIDDVTSELLHAREEAERKEILAMFEALTKDRNGFLAFMDEADEIVKQLHSADLALRQRALHTLKGNAGLVGFGIVAELCHEAENAQAEGRATLVEEALLSLMKRWQTLNEALCAFLGNKGRDVVDLSRNDIEALEREVLAGASATRVQDRLASWLLESADLPLQRLQRYAVALANRLGKGDLEVVVEGHGVRLAPDKWAGLWSALVHVVRNAVDHGLEAPTETQVAGKARPRLRLAAIVRDHTLLVEVEDFGRGINWIAIKTAAESMGLPSATEQDLVRAMFAAGLSTADDVTIVSGRGIGLAATREQVEARGGRIDVVSKPGQGTLFRFSFPLENVGARFGIEAGMDPGEIRAA